MSSVFCSAYNEDIFRRVIFGVGFSEKFRAANGALNLNMKSS